MAEQTFAEKIRAVRDRGISPQQSFIMRHGHTFMGVAFHVCPLKTFEHLTAEDVQWMILEAVKEPHATDLQFSFRFEDIKKFREVSQQLFAAVASSGFIPCSASARTLSETTGWMRMGLFSPDELPDDPQSTFQPGNTQ